jgi:hypothetical protein
MMAAAAVGGHGSKAHKFLEIALEAGAPTH